MPRAKDDPALMILERLQRERIAALYHFTSIDNLPSIRDTDRLCSKGVLCDLGQWPCADPGGNEVSHALDQQNGNWDKLSLTYTPRTPMAYHKKLQKHLCFCVIDVGAATLPDVVFTDTNATSTIFPHKRDTGIKGLELVNFQAARVRPQPWDKDWIRAVQAEILIPEALPLAYVREIVFVSEASLQEAERLWGNTAHPTFRVSPQMFSNDPGALTFNFAFMKQCILTDVEIDENNANQAHVSRVELQRDRTERIFALIASHVTAGTVAETIWSPGNIRSAHTFNTSGNYRHWPRIEAKRLPVGECQVEYRLGGVRWATIPFRMR
jgi:ssDNA thymidine ADP-ribosyltransferase, DarT